MTSTAIWGTYGFHPWWYSSRLRKHPSLVPRANETSDWDAPFPALALATTTSSRLVLSPLQTESALTAHLDDCEQEGGRGHGLLLIASHRQAEIDFVAGAWLICLVREPC
jgi:hypothetical protein